MDNLIQQLTGQIPQELTEIMTNRRKGHMQYFHVVFQSRESTFVKIAYGQRCREAIAAEIDVYFKLSPQPFMPRFIGSLINEKVSAIAIEDLTTCDWSPPWSTGRIDSVLHALSSLERVECSSFVRQISDFKDKLNGWEQVAIRPTALVSKRICSMEWLKKYLPRLIDLSLGALESTSSIIHFDVRSDNLCFRDSQAILLDWSWCCRGDKELQIAAWAPTLFLEGGPKPTELLPDVKLSTLALLSGYFAQFIGTPCPDGEHVRALQEEQLKVLLPWLSKFL